MTPKKKTQKKEETASELVLKGTIVSFDSKEYEGDNEELCEWLKSLTRVQLLELEDLDKKNWFGDLLREEINERNWPFDSELEESIFSKTMKSWSGEPQETLEARIEILEQELRDAQNKTINLSSLVEKLITALAQKVPTVEVPFGEWLKHD